MSGARGADPLEGVSTSALSAASFEMNRRLSAPYWLEGGALDAATVRDSDGSSRSAAAEAAAKGQEQPVAQLLGKELYSIHLAHPSGAFRAADPIHMWSQIGGTDGIDEESARLAAQAARDRGDMDAAGKAAAAIARAAEARSRSLRWAYAMSASCLLAMAVITWGVVPDYPHLGAAAGAFTLTIDLVMLTSLRSGLLLWSPGYMCTMMALQRVFTAAFLGEYWLVGFTLAFFVMCTALAVEAVSQYLPLTDPLDAGAVAYLDADIKASQRAGLGASSSKSGQGSKAKRKAVAGKADPLPSDAAGSPAFGSTILWVTFLLLLSAVVLFGPDGGSETEISFIAASIPVWILGVAGLVLVLLVTLAFGAWRAAYLSSMSLLPRSLRGIYLCRPACGVAFLLGAAAEALLVLAGLLFFSLLESPSILIASVLLPVLVAIMGRVVGQWVANDYRFLEPPERRPGVSDAYSRAIEARSVEAEANERGVTAGQVWKERRSEE